MRFRDREEAAQLLAERLIWAKGKNPLVLGIPRGAVPMAKIIANRLDGEMDVVLVHKIGAPDNPEFAIGSVSEFGEIYKSPVWDISGLSEENFDKAAKIEIDRLVRRRREYSPHISAISPNGRTVLLVDDGIATGSTMLAAARAIRAQNPLKIVVSAPVAAPTAIEMLEPEVDEICVLNVPDNFYAISQFYDSFLQVSDSEVVKILSEAKRIAA